LPNKRDVENFKKVLEGITAETQKEIIFNFRAVLKDVKSQILVYYEKAEAIGVTLDLSEMRKYNRLKKLFSDVNTSLNHLTGQNTQAIIKNGVDIFNSSYYRSFYIIEQEAGVSALLTKVDIGTVRASVLNPLDKIAMLSNNAELKTKFKRIITQDLIQGKSYYQMGQDLKKVSLQSARSWDTIARTEGHRVQSEALVQSYDIAQDKGVEFERTMIATLDDRTRPQSARMDGKKADKNGYFEYPDGRLVKIPGTTGVAKWDINDREIVSAVVVGLEPELRRIRNEGVVPYRNFETWAKDNGMTSNKYGQKYNFDKPKLAKI
jgi:hypothetical protein